MDGVIALEILRSFNGFLSLETNSLVRTNSEKGITFRSFSVKNRSRSLVETTPIPCSFKNKISKNVLSSLLSADGRRIDSRFQYLMIYP
jgi:hypothetical protein